MGMPERVLDGIDRLEPLPITVQKLLVALGDNNVDFRDISDTIEYDGAITSNILRTANSAAFGGRARIEHMRDALVRLGTITLLDILLIGHLRTMRAASPSCAVSEDDLWLHGAAASLAVKAILRETRNRKIPEASTIAALIHDIGKLIMVRYLNAQESAVLARCQEADISEIQAEAELFGCDHAEVGGAIARKWSFPEAITETIERHHEMAPAAPTPMLDAVTLGNLTAKKLGAGASIPGLDPPADVTGASARLGLSAEGFERVCAQTALWIQDLKQNFGISNN